jgi:hypothetical protein
MLGMLVMVFTIIITIYMIRSTSYIGIFIVGSLGIINLWYWLFSPQSVVLEGDIIEENYFFSKRIFKAPDIETINVNRRILNFGRGPREHSFVDIQAKNGCVISIEYFAYKSPDIYEILLEWHKKNSTIGQTNQWN